MRSLLVLHTIYTSLVIIVSAVELDSDLTLASATDFVPRDTGLPLDQGDELSVTQPMSLFDQAKLSEGSQFDTSDASGLTSLPLDPNEFAYNPVDSFLNQPTSLLDVSTLSGGSELYPDDEFDSLFGTDEPNLTSLPDHTIFDNSFELADCASSDSLPVMGPKSRLRRLDDSGSCKNPNTTPPSGTETPPGGADDETVNIPDMLTLLRDPYFVRRFAAARKNRNHNSYCYLFTEGILPWGVCSSGNPEDERSLPERLHIITVGIFDAYDLDHCTLGKSSHLEIYEKYVNTKPVNYDYESSLSCWFDNHTFNCFIKC